MNEYFHNNIKYGVMKKFTPFLSIFLFFVFQFCSQPQPQVDHQKEISAIRTVLERYAIARENEDLSIIEEIWAPDEDIILIGTDSDENLVGWEEIRKAIRRQFGSFENTLISITDQEIKINKNGNTAWFSQMLNYNFIFNSEAMSFEGIRFTGVLEKREGQWRLVQGHLSIPVEVDIEEEMTR